MIPSFQRLAQRIQDELEDLDRSVRRAERAWQAARHAQADQDMYVDSVALNLHSFYAGLERLFEFTARQVDGGLPKGEAWHRELLRQMSTDLAGVRPLVISSETAKTLDEYRRFRHVVRNVYTEHLDPERIGELVTRLPGLWDQLKAELIAFSEFLEGVNRADDIAAE